ncbi:MAG: hypothetical protein IKK91_03725, partial [Ruminococcus sp.]|nr:hypothetical protein [Ruminococcus sp.]
MKKINECFLSICASFLSLTFAASTTVSAIAANSTGNTCKEYTDMVEKTFKLSEDYDDFYDAHIGAEIDIYIDKIEGTNDSYMYSVEKITPSHISISSFNKPLDLEAVINANGNDYAVAYLGNSESVDGITYYYEIYSSGMKEAKNTYLNTCFRPNMLETKEFNNSCLSIDEAKAIYYSLVESNLKTDIANIDYYGIGVQINPKIIERPYVFWLSKEEQVILKTFLSENNINYNLTVELPDDDYSYTTITPNNDVKLEEHYKLLSDIYADTGLYHWTNDIPVNSSNAIFATSIDMHNNLKGDANNDGTLALSDAVAIMQTVGNPDTYGLTAQGEYNADIAGDS